MAHISKAEIRKGSLFLVEGQLVSDTPRPLLSPDQEVVDAEVKVEVTPEGAVKYSVSALVRTKQVAPTAPEPELAPEPPAEPEAKPEPPAEPEAKPEPSAEPEVAPEPEPEP